MGYPIEMRLGNKAGYHTPAEARAYYGKYDRAGVTIHWWNSPNLVTDADHDNICNYILGKMARGTGSVNYVLSNNKITLLVGPDNVAWASQGGNPTTISIECSPHLNAEGYKKLGWLINELYNSSTGRYKRKPGYWKHSDWFQTACPGTISMDKIKQSVARWEDGKWEDPVPVPPKPVPPTSPKNKDFILWKDGGQYVTNKPTVLHDLTNVSSWSDKIPAVKSYPKGTIIDIAGSFHNVGLNREYYITKFSFDNKKATGFNPVDFDIYVPPRPVPEPPKEPELPTDPVEPTDPEPPVEPPKEEVPGRFKDFISKLIDFLKFWEKK